MANSVQASYDGTNNEANTWPARVRKRSRFPHLNPRMLDHWLWLVVDALAVYRLTRLVTDDIISEPLRNAVKRLGEPLASGIECPWCVSFWVSCLVVAASWAVPAQWMPVATVFAFSAVAGFLASHE